MNASSSSTNDRAAPAVPAPLLAPLSAAGADRSAAPRDGSLLSRQLGAVRELVAGMEQLSNAGQRAAMAKAVRFFTGKVESAADGRVGWRTQRVLAMMVEQLARESWRLCPDVGAFARSAENVIALLAATE